MHDAEQRRVEVHTAQAVQSGERASAVAGGSAREPLPDAWSLDNLEGLSRLSDEVARQAAMIGYINAFLLMGIAAALAVPLALFMRAPPKGD